MNNITNSPFEVAKIEIVSLESDIIVTSIKFPFEGEWDEFED